MSDALSLKISRIDRPTLLNLARLFSEDEGTCLLYSGGHYETAKRSFLCVLPYETIRIQGLKQEHCYSNGGRFFLSQENPWEALKSVLTIPEQPHPFPEWTGFLNYEMGAYSDSSKAGSTLSNGIPEAYFQRCAIVLAIDHQTGETAVWIADQAKEFLNDSQLFQFSRLCHESDWEQLIKQSSFNPPSSAYSPPALSLINQIETEESYVAKVEQAKELIRMGEIYQVNLAQLFELQGDIDHFKLFCHLNNLNPAPFSAYFRLSDRTLVSMSPERFLQKQCEWIESRPIKGTAPRGLTGEEDLRCKAQLLSSPKERAELLMITDLMRNDLGKISVTGSVKTPQMWQCETFSNVFHLHATVRAKMLPTLHPLDVVRHCFPGGSITGCPKLRAMEVIAELEGRPRGIYTGSIGYFAGNGDFDFNIAIRTLEIKGVRVTAQFGGGIVSDSDPIKEYEETLHKGSAIFKALNLCIPSTSRA